MGNALHTIVIVLVLALVGLGLYYGVSRFMTVSDLFKQSRDKMGSLCSDGSKKDAAASCLGANLASQYGVSRADEILKNNNVTAIEAAQLIATIAYCGLRCGAMPGRSASHAG